MTSKLNRATNRRNAQKSTGPRTQAGKAKSALNALKHGLSAQPVFDAATQEKIDELAHLFAGKHACEPEVMILARKAAEAQIMVSRVKAARREVWADGMKEPTIQMQGTMWEVVTILEDIKTSPFISKEFISSLLQPMRTLPDMYEPPFENDVERDSAVLKYAAKKLSGFIRYERCAVNARDKAIREMEKLKLMGDSNNL